MRLKQSMHERAFGLCFRYGERECHPSNHPLLIDMQQHDSSYAQDIGLNLVTMYGNGGDSLRDSGNPQLRLSTSARLRNATSSSKTRVRAEVLTVLK